LSKLADVLINYIGIGRIVLNAMLQNILTILNISASIARINKFMTSDPKNVLIALRKYLISMALNVLPALVHHISTYRLKIVQHALSEKFTILLV
jgi:hypothetical protein